jgi:putative transposase
VGLISVDFGISVLCRFMKVCRSAYYAWLRAPESNRALENKALTETISVIFKASRQTYGARRVKSKLALQGETSSIKRIGKLMQTEGLVCKMTRKFIVTTCSSHTKFISPNLLNRNFNVERKNQCWVGDITYIPTQNGWLYLATVIDLYSRKIVGWSMADHMRAELVNDALLMAVWNRKPHKGLIWHTDRGSQYASDSHRAILKDHRIIQSMSRKGDCWDNAVAESFFHTLKTELIHHRKFKNQTEAKADIFEYIEVFYNRTRIHSSNNYLSPEDYEITHKSA